MDSRRTLHGCCAYDAAYDKKIVIYSSIQEYEYDKSGDVRKHALAKLTCERLHGAALDNSQIEAITYK